MASVIEQFNMNAAAAVKEYKVEPRLDYRTIAGVMAFGGFWTT